LLTENLLLLVNRNDSVVKRNICGKNNNFLVNTTQDKETMKLVIKAAEFRQIEIDSLLLNILTE